MRSVPRRESWWSRSEALSRELGRQSPPDFSPNYALIDARRAIQNRLVTKLISVRHSGFALSRGIVVAVCLDLALVFRKYN